MTRLYALGLLLAVLTLGALGIGLAIRHDLGDPLATLSFRLPILLSVIVYLLAAAAVLRPGPKPSLLLILGIAAILRLALVVAPPLLSSDVYRYVWDGRVQSAGINPYLHVPADPALAPLRDTAIYPNINRADYAPTIYPPAAQALFAAVATLSDSVLAMKAAMVGIEALAIGCLLRLLDRTGQHRAQILIYAWNPLALWEFAGNGHVDAAATGLLATALLLRAGGRHNSWAGIAASAAVLVKFLPAIVIPALWQRGRAGRAFALGGIGFALALYAIYIVWGHAGAKVLGFLGAYGAEEGLDTGSGIWALAGIGLLTAVPAWLTKLYLALAAIGLLALGAWIAWRPRPQAGTAADTVRLCGDAAILIICLMLAVSPHYAWYFVWLALPAVIAPYRSAIWLSSSPVLLYYNPLPDHFLWQSLVFAPALALAWFDLRAARITAAPPHAPRPALQGSF